MDRKSVALGAVLAAGALTLVLPGAASADPKLYECQHPVQTGEEAYNLHNISARRACAEVLKLGKWEYADHHITQLYGCHYPNRNSAGYPYLRLHKFDGYTLRIDKQYGFVMSKGRSSFSVTGTDFPLNCT